LSTFSWLLPKRVEPSVLGLELSSVGMVHSCKNALKVALTCLVGVARQLDVGSDGLTVLVCFSIGLTHQI
jgi:hypothetical protein